MIKVKGLTKAYKDKKIIKSFSYKFNNKGLYVVTGVSGSGKTTLLNILAGEDKLFKGCLGVSSSVFYLKDRDNFINSLTLKDNLYLFELVNDKKMECFFDVSSLLNKKIKKLSLGEIQLVSVLLALNSDCKIIILDEPFSALQEGNRKMCYRLIEELSKNKLVIISSHHLDGFSKYKLIDLDNIKKSNVKKFESFNYGKKKEYKKRYYFYYLKKSLFSRLLFVFSLIITIFSFFYINSYSDSLMDFFSSSFTINGGVLIEKQNEIDEMSDNLFYEVCKRLASYVVNYNARYYDASLYNYDVIVNGYYIDNGISLSSFEYMERNLEDNEVVLGIDYNSFCRNNYLFSCKEDYIKNLLINKEIEGFNLYIKDVIYMENTSFYINDRFYKVTGDNDYVEYYLDTKKENINDMFYIINSDDLLSNFNFIKISESGELVRYRVELSESKIINNFEYDNYIVCLDKGYDCLNYLNHFESLVRIDDCSNINDISLGVYDKKLSLNEIVISSGLSKYLVKEKGESISLYFEYNDLVNKVDLYVKDIIQEDSYYLYHNSEWGYYFFKDILCFDNDDLLVKNIIVYDEVKESYVVSNDIYKEMLEEINSVFNNIKKVTFILNIIVTCSSLAILILLELFHNKFKREYFSYLRRLNVEKKNA